MTGMRRETGLAKDQGQETPRMPGMLNPGGFGVMTEIQEMQSPWWGGKQAVTTGCRAIADAATGKMPNQAGTIQSWCKCIPD